MQPNFKIRWRVRRARATACIAALLCVLGAGARALEPTTPVARMGRQAWTMENGLPQNTVQALLASRSGFLWMGTELGLVRFDGNGFLTLSAATRPQFTASDVTGIFEGRDGALWV